MNKVNDDKDKKNTALDRRGVEMMMSALYENAFSMDKKKDENSSTNIIKKLQTALISLPELRENLREDLEKFNDLMENGLSARGLSVAHLQKPGMRLTGDELCEFMIQNLKYKIANTSHEVEKIEGALKSIEKDKYYLSISGKYFDNFTDEEIAEIISCDVSTVRRNRNKLLQKMAVKMYGVRAIC